MQALRRSWLAYSIAVLHVAMLAAESPDQNCAHSVMERA